MDRFIALHRFAVAGNPLALKSNMDRLIAANAFVPIEFDAL